MFLLALYFLSRLSNFALYSWLINEMILLEPMRIGLNQCFFESSFSCEVIRGCACLVEWRMIFRFTWRKINDKTACDWTFRFSYTWKRYVQVNWLMPIFERKVTQWIDSRESRYIIILVYTKPVNSQRQKMNFMCSKLGWKVIILARPLCFVNRWIFSGYPELE